MGNVKRESRVDSRFGTCTVNVLELVRKCHSHDILSYWQIVMKIFNLPRLESHWERVHPRATQ